MLSPFDHCNSTTIPNVLINVILQHGDLKRNAKISMTLLWGDLVRIRSYYIAMFSDLILLILYGIKSISQIQHISIQNLDISKVLSLCSFFHKYIYKYKLVAFCVFLGGLKWFLLTQTFFLRWKSDIATYILAFKCCNHSNIHISF